MQISDTTGLDHSTGVAVLWAHRGAGQDEDDWSRQEGHFAEDICQQRLLVGMRDVDIHK